MSDDQDNVVRLSNPLAEVRVRNLAIKPGESAARVLLEDTTTGRLYVIGESLEKPDAKFIEEAGFFWLQIKSVEWSAQNAMWLVRLKTHREWLAERFDDEETIDDCA
jgi:hypothetical protein